MVLLVYVTKPVRHALSWPGLHGEFLAADVCIDSSEDSFSVCFPEAHKDYILYLHHATDCSPVFSKYFGCQEVISCIS